MSNDGMPSYINPENSNRDESRLPSWVRERLRRLRDENADFRERLDYVRAADSIGAIIIEGIGKGNWEQDFEYMGERWRATITRGQP